MANFKRPQKALFFHRPVRRNFSAIRQGDYKLMLYWKDGAIDRHELYQVSNPIEEGNEITSDNPDLQNFNRLVAHLYLVGAERKKLAVEYVPDSLAVAFR